MFRFDHDASRQGVGDRPGVPGRSIHRSVNLLLLDASRHRRFTGPGLCGMRLENLGSPGKNQMSD
jgi:hypothetical protein